VAAWVVTEPVVALTAAEVGLDSNNAATMPAATRPASSKAEASERGARKKREPLDFRGVGLLLRSS
jgi:hypothetical protein